MRNVLPPAQNHSEDGMGRSRIFSQDTQDKVGCLLPFCLGGTLVIPPLSIPYSPNPRENVLILYTLWLGHVPSPPCGCLFLQELWGRGGL